MLNKHFGVVIPENVEQWIRQKMVEENRSFSNMVLTILTDRMKQEEEAQEEDTCNEDSCPI